MPLGGRSTPRAPATLGQPQWKVLVVVDDAIAALYL
jgi:hypothetical protein